MPSRTERLPSFGPSSANYSVEKNYHVVLLKKKNLGDHPKLPVPWFMLDGSESMCGIYKCMISKHINLRSDRQTRF